jgi:hypothetical protein
MKTSGLLRYSLFVVVVVLRKKVGERMPDEVLLGKLLGKSGIDGNMCVDTNFCFLLYFFCDWF